MLFCCRGYSSQEVDCEDPRVLFNDWRSAPKWVGWGWVWNKKWDQNKVLGVWASDLSNNPVVEATWMTCIVQGHISRNTNEMNQLMTHMKLLQIKFRYSDWLPTKHEGMCLMYHLHDSSLTRFAFIHSEVPSCWTFNAWMPSTDSLFGEQKALLMKYCDVVTAWLQIWFLGRNSN